MFPITPENMPHLVAAANHIIRSREFDYFESSSQALSHAEVEGIDPQTFVLNIGYGEYTGVPRQYPENLNDKIAKVFELVASTQPQDFIHSVNHRLTIGRTLPGQVADENQPGLVIAEHGRSCDLKMPVSEIMVTRMIPHVNSARNEMPQKSIEAVQLRLGRSVLVRQGDYVGDAEKAVYDSHRPWEATLAIGRPAVEAFIRSMQIRADQYRPKAPDAIGRIQALQIMLDD